MKALVIGGGGLLGGKLVLHLRGAGHHVTATTRHADQVSDSRLFLDMLSPRAFEFPDGVTFDAMYLVAAVTGIMRCETDTRTWQVNADAPVELARKVQFMRLADRPHIVFVSSDAVEQAPQLAYAQQKAYAESIILGWGGTVVRPARIPPDQIQGLLALLLQVGAERHGGVFRWNP